MLTVEIKVKIRDYDDMIAKIYKIVHRTYFIKSIDKFYAANNGKLMLREFEEFKYGALVSYKRSDEKGLQVCISYGSLLCHKLVLLGDILDTSNGFIGIVKKKRQAYYTDDAQINVDNVDTLGDFVEIKVVDKDIKSAKKIVNDLMQNLSITSNDLISKSYIDLILEEKNKAYDQLKMFKKLRTLETLEMPGTSKMTKTFNMLDTCEMIDKTDTSKMSPKMNKEKEIQVSSQLQMSKTPKISETFKMPGTSDMLDTCEMVDISYTSEMSEMHEMLNLINKEKKIQVSSQLQMSKTPEICGTFKMPRTLKMTGTFATSGKPEKQETSKSLRHPLLNREVKIKIPSQMPEKPRTLRSFEMPGTSKMTETSDTLETLTSAMSGTSEKHLPKNMEKKTQVSSQLQMSKIPETSGTFKMPRTLKMTGTSATSGEPEKQKIFKLLRHLLLNREVKIKIPSQMPEKPRTLRSFEMPGTSKMTETSDTLETLTSAMSGTSEKHLPKNMEKKTQVSSQLQMSKTSGTSMSETSGTFKMPRTLKMTGTSATSGKSEKQETLKLLRNREVKIKIPSQMPEKPRTLRSFEMPGTSKMTETSDTLETLTSAMSGTSEKHLPKNMEKKTQVSSQLQMSKTSGTSMSETSGTFKMPRTLKMTGTSATSGKSEKQETLKLLRNREVKIKIPSQMPEKPRTLRSFEMPGTSKMTETSDTLETLTSAMSGTSEKHLPK
ncbi:endochitinase A-like isoform X2 [Odontomachus brunneus]|uniref:endochitinase A-like isoform X2 n=1 Tax=Odontomachus brunneus TaxID=486640 RepID=UPI0013F209B3|nr:endochitinase A-like isoform X2 [Odontomachus brunneus]